MSHKKTFNQIFFLKKSQSNSFVIYIRLTVGGKRTEFSTQRTCDPEKWISSNGRVRGKTEDVRSINSYLETIQFRIFEIHRDLISQGADISGEIIKAKFLGITDRPRMLLDIYRQHNRQFAELVGKEFAPGSLKRFEVALRSLQNFIEWRFHSNDIDIKRLGFEFITDYEFYLKSHQGCSHNTTMGYLKKLKKIIRQCIANDWLEKDPFMNFKVTIRDTHRVYLLEEELILLAAKEIGIERLAVVRDLFVFSCYTGLSYSDVTKLTVNDISTGIDGRKWIFTVRTKTDVASRIPLLQPATDIIEKYKNTPHKKSQGHLLPHLSNQRLNSYLKELADMCGIKKELTFHCARHTFATTVTLTNGVPIESVGKMLGHKSLRTTQHYARIIDKKVSDDMRHLHEKFSKPLKPDTNSVAK